MDKQNATAFEQNEIGSHPKDMSAGRYLATRFSTLKPPLHKVFISGLAFRYQSRLTDVASQSNSTITHAKSATMALLSSRLLRMDMGCFRLLHSISHIDRSGKSVQAIERRYFMGNHTCTDDAIYW